MKSFIAVIFSLFSFSLFAQKELTSTSFELYGDHIFISLSVDDSEPMDFIFDTGDGLAVIDLDVANKLNLSLNHKSTKTSAQGSISGALIEHNKIELNEVQIDDIELYSTDLSHLERTIGKNIDGIIGYDLLKNYVVKIDYDDMKVKLYDPSSFNYIGSGQRFAFKLDNYIPHITCSVKLNNGETYEDEFFINTGAGTTMDFNTRFAKKHDVIDKTGEHYSYPVSGLGDQETLHFEGRVMNFGFGTTDFQEMPIGISQAEHGIQNNKKIAGIIGNKVLKRFNITYDYSKKMVYFEENKHFSSPFMVNASGINLQYGEDQEKLLIHRVFENSPADLAGLEVDAEVLEVDGKPSSEYTLPQLRKLLKSTNKSITLKVKQGGQEQEVTLDLTELI